MKSRVIGIFKNEVKFRVEALRAEGFTEAYWEKLITFDDLFLATQYAKAVASGREIDKDGEVILSKFNERD